MKKTPILIPLTCPQAGEFRDPIEEQIRERAYQLYEQRGREDGHDLDDWLRAESEVAGKTKAVAA
ncbi:MAG: DUF2934 domain-containing protein [Terriglobales bacterium]